MEALWTMHYLPRMRYFPSKSAFNIDKKGERRRGARIENSIISCVRF